MLLNFTGRTVLLSKEALSSEVKAFCSRKDFKSEIHAFIASQTFIYQLLIQVRFLFFFFTVWLIYP